MSQKIIRGATAAAIAGSAEQAIQSGVLVSGGSMPTIRELAASLRVSPVTVAGAYRLLQTRGLVVSDGRRGTRVRNLASSPRVRAALRRVPADLVDLASGNPDPALLPPLETALRHLDYHQPFSGAPQHVRSLIAFATGEFEADGIPADAVAVTGGALDAIERILRERLRPGDRVAVEDPTCPGVLDLLRAGGYVVEPIEIDDEGPRPEDFERALRRRVQAVILTPRAQDPTGAAMTTGRAAELKRALRRHRDLLVIENDTAGPIAGAAAVTICDRTSAHWAVVRSTSAFLGPDLRVALLTGDALTVARVTGRQALGARWVSHILQQLALALWSDPSNGRRLARAAEIYAARRGALLAALAVLNIPAVGRSGFNVWIPVSEETATVQALATRGWAVAAGERFRLKSAPAIRVTTSALDADAAQRLAADIAAVTRS
jgi:DNA-binding transcriptional MocR family regulator